MNRQAFEAEALKLGLHPTQADLDAFEAFEDALYKANETRNLTRAPKDECWYRHFIDSVLFQDQFAQGARVLDIGCGPGFPCWPLAALRRDLLVVALDSSGKALDFLRAHPLPNLSIVQDRAEDWDAREKFDVVTGRALAPLPAQLELSAAFAKVGGIVAPMRTPNDALEIERLRDNPLGLELEAIVDRALMPIEAPRRMPIWRKTRRTPRDFPRRWGEMRRKPL